MKRGALLVEYTSSEDDETPEPVPEKKKRKLPPLSSTLKVAAPVDDPTKHQGRVRSAPHVDGQWASYVFVPLSVPRKSPLAQLLRDVFATAQEAIPSLKSIVPVSGDATETSDSSLELRISLTRPIYLRTHQRDEFKTALRQVAKGSTRFAGSFTSFAELINDERTRTFLTLEIGAGHNELKTLCDALNPILRTYRQQSYYERPRFHASVAWALLSESAEPSLANDHDGEGNRLAPHADLRSNARNSDSKTTPSTDTGSKHAAADTFVKIPHLPPSVLQNLQDKIGKDVTRWRLGEF